MTTVHLVHPGGYLQCATWLIAGREGAVLVDPGSGYAEDEVLAGGRSGAWRLDGARHPQFPPPGLARPRPA